MEEKQRNAIWSLRAHHMENWLCEGMRCHTSAHQHIFDNELSDVRSTFLFLFSFFFGWNRRKNRYRPSRIGERRKEVLCFLLGFSLRVGKSESDGIQQLSSCRGVNFDVYIRKFSSLALAQDRPRVHFHYFILFSLCCRKLPFLVRYDIVKCSAD